MPGAAGGDGEAVAWTSDRGSAGAGHEQAAAWQIEVAGELPRAGAGQEDDGEAAHHLSRQRDNARMQDRFEISVRRLGLDDAGALRSSNRASVESGVSDDLLVKTPGA